MQVKETPAAKAASSRNSLRQKSRQSREIPLLMDYRCKQCGRCCHQDIPITIYDVHRIAVEMRIDDRQAFERCVADQVAPRVGIFAMRKADGGACVFLDDQKQCTIHSFKPRVCSFFPCPDILKVDKDLWEQLYLSSAPYEIFWEHAMAENHTKRYIEKYGTQWNAEGYYQTLNELKHYIVTEAGETLLVARDENGRPMELKYNCSRCKVAECRMESEITLMDIDRIASATNCSVGEVFKHAVAKHPHTFTGGLKLKKMQGGSRCIYYDRQEGRAEHCRVYTCRPRFCEFAPCRMRVCDDKSWRCFFFASGDLDGHWELEVAATVTRHYVRYYGTSYHKELFKKHMEEIDTIMNNDMLKEEFLQKIRQYRYDVVPIQPIY